MRRRLTNFSCNGSGRGDCEDAALRASSNRSSLLARRNSSKVIGYINIEWIRPTPNVGNSARANLSLIIACLNDAQRKTCLPGVLHEVG